MRLLPPFALLIAACSGAVDPGAPSPAPPLENAKENTDTAAPLPRTIPNDIDDPSAAARCATSGASPGSLSTIPAKDIARYGVEVLLRLDGEGIEHLDLTLLHPPEFRQDETHGKVRRDRYERYHFVAPKGTHLTVGHFPVTGLSVISHGIECSRTWAATQLGSTADATKPGSTALEITSLTDTRLAGWFEMPGHGGQVERVYFDAPLGDTMLRNFGAVCCLK